MKSYTDISRSKKLAEILPLESADMWYHGHSSPLESEREYDNDACPFHSMRPNWDKPCWSLAALLGVLPKLGAEEPIIQKIYYASNPTERYICQYSLTNMTGEYDNPLDACYEMILKLHEQKLL